MIGINLIFCKLYSGLNWSQFHSCLSCPLIILSPGAMVPKLCHDKGDRSFTTSLFLLSSSRSTSLVLGKDSSMIHWYKYLVPVHIAPPWHSATGPAPADTGELELTEMVELLITAAILILMLSQQFSLPLLFHCEITIPVWLLSVLLLTNSILGWPSAMSTPAICWSPTLHIYCHQTWPAEALCYDQYSCSGSVVIAPCTHSSPCHCAPPPSDTSVWADRMVTHTDACLGCSCKKSWRPTSESWLEVLDAWQGRALSRWDHTSCTVSSPSPAWLSWPWLLITALLIVVTQLEWVHNALRHNLHPVTLVGSP